MPNHPDARSRYEAWRATTLSPAGAFAIVGFAALFLTGVLMLAPPP